MTKRRFRLWLSIAAALFGLILLGQALRFCLLGPPGHWNENVTDKPLVIKVTRESSIVKYWEEFRRKRKQVAARDGLLSVDGDFEGRPRFYEANPELGIDLLQTTTGRCWTEGQHHYFRRDGAWTELRIPSEVILSRSHVVLRGGDPVVLASRWHPYEETCSRFFMGLFVRELRPEHGVYELKLPGGELRYLWPGRDLRPSPDRRRVAFLRSDEGLGSHSLHILEVSTFEVSTLATLIQAASASDISFDYLWSDDSRALGLAGQLYGEGEVELVYTLDSETFWKVAGVGGSEE